MRYIHHLKMNSKEKMMSDEFYYNIFVKLGLLL